MSLSVHSMDQKNFSKMPNSMLSCNERILWKWRIQCLVDRWIDGFTSGCWFCKRSKDCSIAQTLPYAGLCSRGGYSKEKIPLQLQHPERPYNIYSIFISEVGWKKEGKRKDRYQVLPMPGEKEYHIAGTWYEKNTVMIGCSLLLRKCIEWIPSHVLVS